MTNVIMNKEKMTAEEVFERIKLILEFTNSSEEIDETQKLKILHQRYGGAIAYDCNGKFVYHKRVHRSKNTVFTLGGNNIIQRNIIRNNIEEELTIYSSKGRVVRVYYIQHKAPIDTTYDGSDYVWGMNKSFLRNGSKILSETSRYFSTTSGYYTEINRKFKNGIARDTITIIRPNPDDNHTVERYVRLK